VAERLAQDILALFMYPGLEPRHVDEVAETMLDELNGGMSV
jgi:dTDP-4-amino-4,6-dideoxygalactose transaminase